jgi:hypothetical protein
MYYIEGKGEQGQEQFWFHINGLSAQITNAEQNGKNKMTGRVKAQ